MKKTTSIIAMIAGFTVGTALPARAQTAQPDTDIFVNVSVGGQLQSREFSSLTTFPLFDETATVTANQTIGSGFVFDVTGGYRFWQNVSGAVGVSTSNASGSAAALAAIPNPLFRGKPTVFTFSTGDYGDLKQSTVSINFQIVWIRPVTDRLDLSIFGGPSVIRVKQEFASATAVENSAAAIESQSETTAKAGTVGADLRYRLNDRYGVGGFVRYAGGQVDLPAASNLTVGGVQVGGGIRIRF